MTKGRVPDRDISDDLFKVLDELRSKCSFDHLSSSHGRNCILMTAKEDQSRESLFVIDLEHWQKVLV
jgi:hypothetical protein